VAHRGVHHFPYDQAGRFVTLALGYWPELAGGFYGQTLARLQDQPAAEALYWAYYYLVNLNEFRQGARKSMEDFLTLPLDELIAQDKAQKATASFEEALPELMTELELWESEIGVTREKKKTVTTEDVD
jgi:hypothetical protein